MEPAATHEITALLRAWEKGQAEALDRLIPLVYGELKRLARRRKRHSGWETLQTTELVHEAYIRLLAVNGAGWRDRTHFFAVSARVIRAILVDAARIRLSEKRGGPSQPADVDLEKIPDMGAGRADEILAVHEALEHLARMDARQAQVVEMRFFGGLSVEEAAAVLKVSPQSVMRDWRLAKVWLRREIVRTGDRRSAAARW